MQAGANAEWQRLKAVMVHEPGPEVFFALLAPSAHLYERFFDRGAAQEEHRQLCRMLHADYGVQVLRLRDVVTSAAREDGPARQALLDFAAERLGLASADETVLRAAISTPLDERDAGHLFDIAVLNPVLGVHGGEVDTSLSHPLYNLYFMRDQQAATDRGIVRGRMASQARQGEGVLSSIGIAAAGAATVHQVATGPFEGGDFIPAGSFAFVGTGSRTSPAGAADFLDGGASFDSAALVARPRHPLLGSPDPMLLMHLDTWFNIAGDGIVVANPLLLAAAEVSVLERDGRKYRPSGSTVMMDAYLKEQEFEVIPITTLEQLCYASNFLCVRDRECIAPDTRVLAKVVLERLAEKAAADPGRYTAIFDAACRDYRQLSADAEFFPHKKEVYAHGLEMATVTLTNATGGYGGAHCMTCVLSRG